MKTPFKGKLASITESWNGENIGFETADGSYLTRSQALETLAARQPLFLVDKASGERVRHRAATAAELAVLAVSPYAPKRPRNAPAMPSAAATLPERPKPSPEATAAARARLLEKNPIAARLAASMAPQATQKAAPPVAVEKPTLEQFASHVRLAACSPRAAARLEEWAQAGHIRRLPNGHFRFPQQ